MTKLPYAKDKIRFKQADHQIKEKQKRRRQAEQERNLIKLLVIYIYLFGILSRFSRNMDF